MTSHPEIPAELLALSVDVYDRAAVNGGGPDAIALALLQVRNEAKAEERERPIDSDGLEAAWLAYDNANVSAWRKKERMAVALTAYRAAAIRARP